MKESRIQKKRNKPRSNKQTEPNRTNREGEFNNKTRSRKKADEAEAVPVKVKAQRTNNAPSKRRNDSSDRRHEKGGRTR